MFKITNYGKTKIINNNLAKKPKEKDLLYLFNYLDNRSFNNHPKIIKEDEEYYYYDYLTEITEPLNQKCSDMAIILASLHNKTVYFKTISEKDKKQIIEQLTNAINYSEEYYKNIFDTNEKMQVYSPSIQLLFSYKSKFNSLFFYIREKIKKYTELLESVDRQRVVYCHNNLQIEHFNSKNKSFVSWDKYCIDTPILDILNLYKNDYYKYDFACFLKKYIDSFSLNEDELVLLFIVLSIPENVELTANEFDNTLKVSKVIYYINKTEKLLSPYDSK